MLPPGSLEGELKVNADPAYVSAVLVSSIVDGHVMTLTRRLPVYGEDESSVVRDYIEIIGQYYFPTSLFDRTAQLLIRSMLQYVSAHAGPEAMELLAQNYREVIDKVVAERKAESDDLPQAEGGL